MENIVKVLKITGIMIISIVLSIAIFFFSYTSFVDTLNIQVPEKTDFIHPSRLLIKYEVFISGTVLRPAYLGFIRNLNLSGNEKILDFGSGAGGEAIHLAEIIKNKNGTLTCIDISHSWLEVVKYKLSNHKNIHFIEGDIVKYAVANNSFDTIIIRLVLHDIPRDQRKSIIHKFHDILKPGGSIYIFEPLGKDHAIDEAEMRTLFRNAGFKERHFNRSYSFVMLHLMGEAAYDK